MATEEEVTGRGMSQLDDKIDELLKKQKLDNEAPAKPDTPAKSLSPRAVAKKSKTATRPAKKKTKKKAVRQPKVDPELFAHRYVMYHCNGTAAYMSIRPDVKPEAAAACASRLLKTVKVQNVLWPLLEGLLEKESAQSDWVIKRWLEQAEASPLDYFSITPDGGLGGLDLTNLSQAQRRNLKSIRYNRTVTTTTTDHSVNETVHETWHVTVVDQQKAVELLAKMLGMLQPKMDSEDVDRIGDLLERGVKRIQQSKDLDGWRTIDGEFSEVG